MPIYEYQCRPCRRVFEVLVRSQKDEENAVCPDCKSSQVDRQLSVFAARGGESSGDQTVPGPMNCGQMCARNGACPYKP